MTAGEPSSILAIDIGAKTMKSALVSPSGDLLSRVRQRGTPYPCSPSVLVEAIAARCAATPCDHVGVGFPGEFRDGVVVHPGNLARPGGITTDVDPTLDAAWRGYPLTDARREVTGCDVRIVNDARLAGYGAVTGTGREIVLTLGTGCGFSFFVEGQPQDVRDLGDEECRDGFTCDELIGERSRLADDTGWRADVHALAQRLVEEFGATSLHLAGGNARRFSREAVEGWGVPVSLHGNDVALGGAAALFR
jgi:polyphosphate glucokinase